MATEMDIVEQKPFVDAFMSGDVCGAPAGQMMGGYSHPPPEPSTSQQQERLQLERELEAVQAEIHAASESLRQMRHDQENFIIQYQESNKLKYQLDQMRTMPNGTVGGESLARLQKDKELFDQTLQQKAVEMIHARYAAMSKFNELYGKLHDSQMVVIERELRGWQRAQQLSGNSIPYENNLDQIQGWCEMLAESIWNLKNQLGFLRQCIETMPLQHGQNQSPVSLAAIDDLLAKVTRLLSILIQSTCELTFYLVCFKRL